MSSKCLIIFLFLVTCDYNTGKIPPTHEDFSNECALNPAGGDIEDLSPLSSQASMTCGLIPENRKRPYEGESEIHKKPKLNGDCSDGKTQKIGDKQFFDSPKEVDGFDPSNQTDQQTVDTRSSLHIGSDTLITREIKDHIEEQVKATVASYFEEQVKATVASYFEALQTEMNMKYRTPISDSMASNIDYNDDDDDNTEIEALSIGLFVERNIDMRNSPHDQPKTPAKPPPPTVSAHGGGNIEELSLLSCQAIKNRNLAPDDNLKKRPRSDDVSGKPKKQKVKEAPTLDDLEGVIWNQPKTPDKQNPAGVATRSSLHIDSNTSITREIKDHIEEQVKATVVSYFEEQVKATVASYFEEQVKAMVASYYEEQKVDKSKKGGITAIVKKIFG